MLIVIDGLDGCGKSTQLELLKEKFTNAHFITFPYYNTNSGKIVSDYLSGKFQEKTPAVSAYSASAIYAVDRYTSFKTHWEELYNSNSPVISARYTTSNAIYQMTKLDKSLWDEYLDWLYDFEYNKIGIPAPDKVIFLDMPVEVSQKLMTARYNGDESKKDVHEANVEFLNACREAALYAAEKYGWSVINCAQNGEPLPIEFINDSVYALVLEALKS